MRSQIKLGRIFGIEIGLHYSWFFIALLIVFSLFQQFHAENQDWGSAIILTLSIATALLFFVSLLLHELSHSLFARSRGLPVREITLFALGGVSQIEKSPSSAKTEFWMAIVVGLYLAIWQRASTVEGGSNSIDAGDVSIDLARHLVTVRNEPVNLTRSEFQVLRLLADRPGQVFSRLEIMEELWQSEFSGDVRACDVHISNLRQKIERDPQDPELVVTVRGIGYKLVEPE